MSQHTLRVQTYRVQNTWCQQQFVFNIWCTWRHCRRSVAGVMCTKYILLLDIGITSAFVDGSIYSTLPSLWNCISFFYIYIFLFVVFVGVYGNWCDAAVGYSDSDDSVLHNSWKFTSVFFFMLVAFKRWWATATQSELGMYYVSCLYRSSLCLGKHHAMTACSGRQNYTHS